MTTTTKKISKVERLQAAIAAAKQNLAAREAALQPAIEAEHERVQKLKAEYNRLDNAQRKAGERDGVVGRAAAVRLGLTGEARAKLETELKAFATSKGLPLADADRLADIYASKQLAADAEVIAAKAEWNKLYRARDKAQSAYNVATSPASPLAKMQRELADLRDGVKKLETELERVPARNEAARDRRRAEAEAVEESNQTAAAETLLGEFVRSEGP